MGRWRLGAWEGVGGLETASCCLPPVPLPTPITCPWLEGEGSRRVLSPLFSPLEPGPCPASPASACSVTTATFCPRQGQGTGGEGPGWVHTCPMASWGRAWHWPPGPRMAVLQRGWWLLGRRPQLSKARSYLSLLVLFPSTEVAIPWAG